MLSIASLPLLDHMPNLIMVHAPGPVQVASVGIPDTFFLMLLALIVFGPRRLPEIGRQIGKLMYEFRKVSNDFKFQMEEELRASEQASRQQQLQAGAATAATLEAASLPASTSEFSTPEASTPLPAYIAATGLVEPSYSAVPDTDPNPIAPPSDSAPQIQPPSSGETVSASRPFRTQSSTETAPPIESPESSIPAEPSVASEPSVPAIPTEQNGHHA